jgi:hypothetical protein
LRGAYAPLRRLLHKDNGVFKRGHDPSFYSSPSQTRDNTRIKIFLFERGIKGVSKEKLLNKMNLFYYFT